MLTMKVSKQRLVISCVALALLLGVFGIAWQQAAISIEDNQEAYRRAGILGQPFERVFEKSGQTYLWGGTQDDWHFNITQSDLNLKWIQHGLGREYFPALIDPKFISAEKADTFFDDQARMLVVSMNEDVKVYPVKLLIRHEVVNDVVGGHPIFAAYCILADLGAVYSRKIGEETFTFALTGYTYFEPDVWRGMNAFLLWDRETESIWWPPKGKAMAGPLMDAPLPLFPERYWSQTTWGAVKKHFDAPRVLEPNQTMKVPEHWPQIKDPAKIASVSGEMQIDAVAPQWGENALPGEPSGSASNRSAGSGSMR